MKNRTCLAVLAALFFIAAPAAAQYTVAPARNLATAPQSPGFLLQFNFVPPLSGNINAMPIAILEACRDQTCHITAGAITLHCLGGNVRNRSDVAIGQCSAAATQGPYGPDGNLVMLSQPVYLRVRVNNLVSAPFYFLGAQPSVPNVLYRYIVNPGPGGFAVSPG